MTSLWNYFYNIQAPSLHSTDTLASERNQIAWERVIFGGYLGDNPKTLIKIVSCCKLFYDGIGNDDWKNFVINFKFLKIDECKSESAVIWRQVFCKYSNEINDIAKKCVKKIESKAHDKNHKIEIYELLKPFTDSLSHPYSNAKAQTCFAYSYDSNLLDNKDQDKAFMYFKLAADQGYPEAQYQVGRFYQNGNKFFGLEQDKEKAFMFFKSASDQGHYNATIAVSNCYLLGDGVNVDLKKYSEYRALSINQYKCDSIDEYLVINIGKLLYKVGIL